MNKNKYDISSIKRVTRKFLVVSPHVVVDVQINGKEMYKKKKCAARPSPLSNTQLYILFEQTINIIGSFAFSPG